MIALGIIVVVLTYSQLWDPVECGCIYSACGAGVTNNLQARIKYNDRFLACSYQPQPDERCPCYNIEENGAPCLAMVNSFEGRCFRGECYDNLRYLVIRYGQRLNYSVPCPVPSDYMYHMHGETRWNFGCKYNCLNKPHNEVSHPDDSHCLVPSQASPGICDKGYCKII
ncbi:uncharacterized protein LOC135370169 isoform X1 [Ornithodoros turicata]|uniref:uncharacterized protein LOC135370169 isoform X1 n=1 Tax=Ornithodoros turicata TaxID=34597 RepID=UPI003139AFC7